MYQQVPTPIINGVQELATPSAPVLALRSINATSNGTASRVNVTAQYHHQLHHHFHQDKYSQQLLRIIDESIRSAVSNIHSKEHH